MPAAKSDSKNTCKRYMGASIAEVRSPILDTDGMKVKRFAPLGFGLHYRNMDFITSRDFLLPSIGGAASSLIGNVLLELGLHYVDLTKDALRPDGSSDPAYDPITRRIRCTGRQHLGPARAWSADRLRPRFMKTHLPEAEFTALTFRGVWLLVRDPRDALYSWYRYHRNFAQADWERVPDS